MSQNSSCEWMELSKSQRKAFESFGHVWTKFSQAQTLLGKKALKGQVPASLAPWLTLEAVAPDFTPGFVLLVDEIAQGEDAPQYQWHTGIADAETLQDWATTWKAVAPEPVREAAWTRSPASMNAPVWSALLRLNELKSFWIQELRQNHYDALKAWLPETWLYLSEPLPPGATLARLGKSSWRDAVSSGMALEKTAALSVGARERLTVAHLEHRSSELEVIQLAAAESPQRVALFFAHQSGKTQLLGALRQV